jgi:hypothetical protein
MRQRYTAGIKAGSDQVRGDIPRSKGASGVL